MSNDFKPTKAKFIKPQNRLKIKVGSGGIDQRLIKEADEIINNNNIDFAPYVLNLLDKIKATLEAGRANNPNEPSSTFIKSISPLVMQIKAHGSLFHYHLLTDIANNILHFLEHTDVLNADTYNLIDAHYNTMTIITKNKIRGDGGKAGEALLIELNAARERYIQKYIIQKS